MKLDVSDIKSLIRECAEEIRESCGDKPKYTSHKHHNRDEDHESDLSLRKQKWFDFSEACIRDREFSESIFLPLLAKNPEIVSSILQALEEEEELHDEIYRALRSIKDRQYA